MESKNKEALGKEQTFVDMDQALDRVFDPKSLGDKVLARYYSHGESVVSCAYCKSTDVRFKRIKASERKVRMAIYCRSCCNVFYAKLVARHGNIQMSVNGENGGPLGLRK